MHIAAVIALVLSVAIASFAAGYYFGGARQTDPVAQVARSVATPIVQALANTKACEAKVIYLVDKLSACAAARGEQKRDLARAERSADQAERDTLDMIERMPVVRYDLKDADESYRAWAEQPIPDALERMRHSEDCGSRSDADDRATNAATCADSATDSVPNDSS